jgi:hypothetical protein
MRALRLIALGSLVVSIATSVTLAILGLTAGAVIAGFVAFLALVLIAAARRIAQGPSAVADARFVGQSSDLIMGANQAGARTPARVVEESSGQWRS